MKKIVTHILFALMLVTTVTATAQQYPVFSQYYFNELVINPAYAGNHVQLSLTSMYRNQWINFPGAPRTLNFTGHTALYKNKMGVGLMINHDEIGSYRNQNVFAQYAYKLNFREATLAMGLQAGFNFVGADFSQLNLLNPDDPSFSFINSFKPNFGGGIYYSKKNFFVGFSVPMILNNAYPYSLETALDNIKEARYYFLRSGIIFPINRQETVKLNPSILLRTQEGQPVSVDLNLGAVFYDVISIGASYRNVDAFITFIDLKISEKFHFAYSYDWTVSDIRQFSNGSHEFVLNYRAKVTQAHKNLTCPQYYYFR
jgi:type IX secretion system PorP/SprF family membrane protein